MAERELWRPWLHSPRKRSEGDLGAIWVRSGCNLWELSAARALLSRACGNRAYAVLPWVGIRAMPVASVPSIKSYIHLAPRIRPRRPDRAGPAVVGPGQA